MAKKVTKKAGSTKKSAKKTTANKKAKPKAKPKTGSNRNSPKIIQARTISVKKPSSKAGITKRPPLTPAIPQAVVEDIINGLTQVKADLEEYAAHLRTLDRKRLNNIGVKREGFAQRAYRLAMDNPEFLPNYLAQERYTEDFDQFTIIQTAVDLESQINELLLNINTEAMDFFYTDGLDFYASVREASERRVDAAESIHRELFDTYFKRKKSTTEGETEKQMLRDAKGIIKGTKNGKIEAVNIKPTATGGKHEIIDETYKNKTNFKATDEGQIEE